MPVRLKVVHGKPHGACLQLREGVFLIGRAPECHIRPNSELVSARHCQLRIFGHQAHVRDLGSANGTFVNGKPLLAERTLIEGDYLQMGSVVLQIVPSDQFNGAISRGSLAVLSGMGVTCHGAEGDTNLGTSGSANLQIQSNRIVVIGRLEGGEVPYLDPRHQPTTTLPNTGQTILRCDGQERDRYVSRAHFMLRFHPRGIMLVNGVPRADGGIRPPLNGSWLLVPVSRALHPSEEYLIERGTLIVLRLPNESVIQIAAH